jgi:hypothetical protein
MKKMIITYGKNIFLKKNIVLKNSLNYIFFRKLKNLYKKNLFLNFFFFNKFINLYKNNNLCVFKKSFLLNNKNVFYVYNLNIFKKQFLYNINDIKSFFKKIKTKFLFLKKKQKLSFFFNNCFIINSNVDIKINDFNDLNNILFFKLNFKKNYLNYFFINFNIFIFNILEIYKILIFFYLIKLKLNIKYI